MLAPNGGETLAGGSTYSVTWSAGDPDTPAGNLQIAIDYSADGGSVWHHVAGALPNSGSYAWSVPDTATTHGRIRVTVSDGQQQSSDTADADFTITGSPPYRLDIGAVDGGVGAQVTVPVSLTNAGAVDTLQFQLQFDPAVAQFNRLTSRPSARLGTMQFDAQDLGGGVVSILFASPAGDSLPAGSGPLAQLAFQLVGANRSSTPLTPGSVRARNPRGQALPVEAQAGRLTVAESAQQLVADGWAHFQQEQFPAAVADFRSAIADSSQYAEAYTGLGWGQLTLAVTTDSLQAALSSFDEAISLGSTWAGLRAGRAAACLGIGGSRLSSAAVDALAALQEPTFVFPYRTSFDAKDLYLILAFARAGQGDFSQALSDAGNVEPNQINQGDPNTWEVDGVAYRSFEGAVLALLQKLSTLYSG